MYTLFCETNKKSIVQKEMKDLTFEVFNFSTHFYLNSFP